jgi:hypothetical protein
VEDAQDFPHRRRCADRHPKAFFFARAGSLEPDKCLARKGRRPFDEGPSRSLPDPEESPREWPE